MNEQQERSDREKECRDDSQALGVDVVLLTVYGERGDRKECRERGWSGVGQDPPEEALLLLSRVRFERQQEGRNTGVEQCYQ